MAHAGRLSFALFALCLFVLSRSSDAQTASSDPAARGLDVFVHAPDRAASGTTFPLQIEAFGFPTVTSLVPLAGATIEAVWNPESLGAEVTSAPPAVKVTADASGRARLDVRMPEGDDGALELLIGVRSGAHTRTRTLKIARSPAMDVQIHVADSRVVPGSSVSVWVLVTSASTSEPLAKTPIDLLLLEGGVPSYEARLSTDPAGNAMARVPIPRTHEPSWSWTLEARAFAGEQAKIARLELTPREETPGTPEIEASFKQASVLAGEKADYVVRVLDATGEPIADLPVRTWSGPRGTHPPKDDKEWLKLSTRAMTNAGGEIRGSIDTPSTVVAGVGSTMTLIAKANVDGHDLERTATVAVGYGTAQATLSPEAKSIVPGVEQRMLLRVRDGHDKPISAPFLVEGDGLKAEVRTDPFGEAEVVWKAPPDVGAARNVGPCAGGVAASVRVRATADVPALAPRRDPFDLCVAVDREAGALIRLDKTAARIGDKVHVEIVPSAPSGEAKGTDRKIPRGPWSVVARSNNGLPSGAVWIEDGERGGDLDIGKGEPGVWTVSAASPGTKSRARVVSTALLVAPRTLPKISASVSGGRIAPGGAAEVDASLADERGQPLVGSVAALMIDEHGGGSTRGIESLDTRALLCGAFEVSRERCDKVVEGDPSLDAVRRGDLADRGGTPIAPLIDPGANVNEALTKSFADVLHSLEGAVFQAAATPDQLRDVRRKVDRAWQFNPELMTLVTAAMTEPPMTPGGEPVVLGDLLAVDPQVTFDNVARRITRLKLFHILAEVRSFRHEHQLDADEPALQNPNAILRRLVREGRLTDDMLLDPWGGTIQFTKAGGPPIPFLSVIRGFELHAPGPDGTVGSRDDVKDPFERVLKSGTPYAKAVQEDRIVDARFEMEVGDATVAAWQSMFNELTGTEIGEAFGAGGLGLSGIGEGGGGRGEGIGLGSIGTIGHGRGTFGVESGVAFWAAPARTDDKGHIHFHVPLPDRETTWRLALVALPDAAGAPSSPATTTVDIPVALPLSVRVDAGATWVEGDEMNVAVTIRNRGTHPIAPSIAFAASGVAFLADLADPSAKLGEAGASAPASRSITVPAESAVVSLVRVRAPRAGMARLDVRVQAAGVPEDIVNHTWEVLPPGEPTDFTSAQWVEGDAELTLTMPPQSIRVTGTPRIVLERGYDRALAGALEALDPDVLTSPGAMADAIEVAARVRRWAMVRGGEKDPLAERSDDIAHRATGKLATYSALHAMNTRFSIVRAIPFAPARLSDRLGTAPDCPDGATSIDDRLDAIEAEPPPVAGSSKACWDAFVTNTVEAVTRLGDAVELARLVLSLAERPHRAVLATSLADRLRERVKLQPSGRIALPDALESKRSARAIVFAALLRSIRIGKSVAGAEKLASWVLVQRDVQGGYGSPEATRYVVRALLAEGPDTKDASRVTFEANGARREVDVPPSAHLVIPLDPKTTKVSVSVKGKGVIARFERPVLRLWSHPPDEIASALHVEAQWPSDAHAGKTGVLRLQIRHALAREITTDLKIPLPPGVTLAEPVSGARLVQGVLSVRRALDASELTTTIELPVRFALAGRVTAPEIFARVAFEDLARGIAPARPVTILP